MRLITFDFETFYGDDYTLSKMTTEAYVRDPRFETIMIGVKEGDTKPYTVLGPDVPHLMEDLQMHKAACVAHHAHFDGLILNHHYGVRPKIWFDTIPMARAQIGSVAARGLSLGSLRKFFGLHDKGEEVIQAKGKRLADFTPQELAEYRRYCCEDVEATRYFYDQLAPMFSADELKLMDITTRLFTEPILEMDQALLEDYRNQVIAHKATLMMRCGTTREDLTSNNKFAEVLRRMGIEPGLKKSITTGKNTYAFAKADKFMTDLLENTDEDIVMLAEARIGVKTSIAETRAQRFMDMGSRGPAPVYLKYWGAEQTGRHSAADKSNFLNLGRNKPLDIDVLAETSVIVTPLGRAEIVEYGGGKEISTTLGVFPVKKCHHVGLRDALCAPPGHVIVVGDSSNIEARMVCYLAGQEDVLEIYRNNGDPYCDMGGYVVGRVITKEDPERQLGKVIVLACGFGMGVKKFLETANKPPWKLGIDEKLASAGVYGYRDRYNKVKESWDYFGEEVIPAMADGKQMHADASGLIVTGKDCLTLPNGRKLMYPNLRQAMVKEYNELGEEIGARLQWVFDVREGSRIIQSKLYGGRGVENITQAMARIVVMDQTVRVSRKYRVALSVYDEVVCCVPEEQAEECKEYIQHVLSTPPAWAPDLPVACETGTGGFYGAAK